MIITDSKKGSGITIRVRSVIVLVNEQVIMFTAHRKRDGLEALIYKLGTTGPRALGGRGAVSGMLANFKSVAFIIAPSIYSAMYPLLVLQPLPNNYHQPCNCTQIKLYVRLKSNRSSSPSIIVQRSI